MRIAFSGTANTGKTTLIKNFLAVWPQYRTPQKTYRDVLIKKKLTHSSKTTTEAQWDILNFMIDQLQSTEKNEKVVFDRCPLDNVVYTLWAHEKGLEGFTKEFVDKTITLSRESLRHLDIIFLLQYDENIKIEDDNLRDTSVEFITEIDNIFSALHLQYEKNYDANIFFPKDDSPGFIILPTSPQDRINLISEYLTPEGEMYGDETSIFNPNNIKELEGLVQQQQAALEAEKAEKELYKKFGLGS